MATIKMLDPRASVNTKDRPLVPGLDTLEGKVIGIIDNGQGEFDNDVSGAGKAARGKIPARRSAV